MSVFDGLIGASEVTEGEGEEPEPEESREKDEERSKP